MIAPFFIIGAGRSGTTALVHALDLATNSSVYSEQNPKLCIAARMQYEGMLPYPKEFIEKSKQPFICQARKDGMVYGDKNPNYIHFIDFIKDIWDAKFLFVTRDGRDVVRSRMDFHPKRGPGYDRYEDRPMSSLTQPEDSFWDFSRLRPKRGTETYEKWRSMDKFEKYSWAWANYNAMLLEHAECLDDRDYEFIDMTNLSARDVRNIYSFLNLEEFDLDDVDGVLSSKVNTTKVDGGERFPSWEEWDAELQKKFDRYAMSVMKLLDYY